MSDRELLEMAAKAASISGRFIEQLPEDGYPTYRCFIGSSGSQHNQWNPLDDDGDALRLAVALGLVVDSYNFRSITGSRLGAGHNDWAYSDCEEECDEYAATRRAIVRAAAEIGRAMP